MTREQVKKYIDVMKAYNEDKKIQCRWLEFPHSEWRDTKNPSFNFEKCEYRIKSEYTEEQLTIMEAFNKGKTIQYRHIGADYNFVDLIVGTINLDTFAFYWDLYEYRIKPEPKYRPFKNAEEFFPYREKWLKWGTAAGTYFYKIVTFTDESIFVMSSYNGTPHSYTYKNIFDNCVFDDGTLCGVKE